MVCSRRVAACLLTVTTLLVGTASRAHAHGIAGLEASPVLSEVDRISPPSPGVSVRIADDGRHVVLVNDTPASVVVEGYDGEAYLRIGPAGVERNRRSPATYLNREVTPSDTAPAIADAAAPPEWEWIGSGNTARWHDHRSHWMGGATPLSVDTGSGADRPEISWSIPLRINGRSVVVEGAFRWPAPPRPLPWLLAIGFLTGAAAVAMARSRLVRASVLAILAAACAILTLAADSAVDEPALSRIGRGAYGLVAVIVTLYAVGRQRRHDASDAAPALIAVGLLSVLGVGIPRFDWYANAVLPVSIDAAAARSLLAALLAFGFAAGITGARSLRRPTASPRPSERRALAVLDGDSP